MSDETAKPKPEDYPDSIFAWWSSEKGWSYGENDEIETFSTRAAAEWRFGNDPARFGVGAWQLIDLGIPCPAWATDRDSLIREVGEWSRKAGFAEGRADGLEIERDALRAEVERLKAELATLRGEGPLRVGDVVQMLFPDGMRCMFIVEPSNIAPDGFIQQSLHLGAQIHRIGRAVRMPDGTPVDQ